MPKSPCTGRFHQLEPHDWSYTPTHHLPLPYPFQECRRCGLVKDPLGQTYIVRKESRDETGPGGTGPLHNPPP